MLRQDCYTLCCQGQLCHWPKMASIAWQKPRGLQEWNVFGAPDGCSGNCYWHPKKQEHKFMGYMIAMHFVRAPEHIHEIQLVSPDLWHKPYLQTLVIPKVLFPNPLSFTLTLWSLFTKILFGTKINTNQFQIIELSCWTNLLLAVYYERVVAGMAVETTVGNNYGVPGRQHVPKGFGLEFEWSGAQHEMKSGTMRGSGLHSYEDCNVPHARKWSFRAPATIQGATSWPSSWWCDNPHECSALVWRTYHLGSQEKEIK